MDDLQFYILSAVFRSYQDDDGFIMKCCVDIFVGNKQQFQVYFNRPHQLALVIIASSRFSYVLYF